MGVNCRTCVGRYEDPIPLPQDILVLDALGDDLLAACVATAEQSGQHVEAVRRCVSRERNADQRRE